MEWEVEKIILSRAEREGKPLSCLKITCEVSNIQYEQEFLILFSALS